MLPLGIKVDLGLDLEVWGGYGLKRLGVHGLAFGALDFWGTTGRQNWTQCRAIMRALADKLGSVVAGFMS